jgi:hypothetical protein
MAVSPLNRYLSCVAACFAFVGVILGAVALGTNYWTVENIVVPSTAVPMPNGTMFGAGNEGWAWNVSFILYQSIKYQQFIFFRVFSIHVQLVEIMNVYPIFGQQHLSFV